MNISGLVILEMKGNKLVEKAMDWESFDTFFYQFNDSDSESGSNSKDKSD
jgi:hypothetical protein